MLTVYTKNNCVQCKATERLLGKLDIKHQIINLDTDKDAVEYVTETLGYKQAPVVVTEDHLSWAGFRPDHIKAYAKKLELA